MELFGANKKIKERTYWLMTYYLRLTKKKERIYWLMRCVLVVVVVCCCFLTLTDPLRIQPWSQDRRNQTKSTGNRR